MEKHFQTTLVLLAATLSACTLAGPEQPILVADEDESVTCKNEAPIDSHIKVFNCQPVNKINVGRDSPAIAAEPDREVQVPEGKCGSE
jgi:hypothetical protein